MTARAWLKHAADDFARAGCPDPETDARWMLEDGLNLSPTDARRRLDDPLSEQETYILEEMRLRRMAREPLQYITHRADFMGLTFYVDKGVLIPRADTECLAEAALKHARRMPAVSLLDVCAGSGAIGLSVQALSSNVRATLTDISADALSVIWRNADRLSVQAEILAGDLFAPVQGRRFDIITINPPYIQTGELATLQAEVLQEPTLALDGGADGLNFYRRIADEAQTHMTPGGILLLEVGNNQAGDVQKLLAAHFAPENTGRIQDLHGIDRVIWAKAPI